jgi:predicted DNA-binding transcriptional regulator YafY
VLAFVLGERLTIGSAGVDEWVDVEMRGHHVNELASALSGFGETVDVVEPVALREELLRLGRQLVARYGS